MEIADLVLIPCRPSALDLAAIQTNAKLVAGYGTSFCLVIIPRPTRREGRKHIADFFFPPKYCWRCIYSHGARVAACRR